MITIKEKGRAFRVTNYGTGADDGTVIASDPFAVSMAIAHWTHRAHDPRLCPVCRVDAERRRVVAQAA